MNGFEAETIAAKYLRAKNFEILERNYRIREGEIDLIAKDNDTLVFIEVKYLFNPNKYYPEEQVSLSKQKKLSKAALSYLQNKKYDDPCRFDVVAIHGTQSNLQFDHFIDAFEFN